MTFLTEKGTFVKRTSTGTDVISHSLGETPKIIILWTTAQTSTGFATEYIYSMGFSDTSSNRGIGMSSEDAQTMSDTSKVTRTTDIMLILTENGVNEAQAAISAESSTNFTVNWTLNNGGADIIHYMLFAGDDITDFEVRGFTANTTTGNQTITTANSPTDGYDFFMFLTTEGDDVNLTVNGQIGIGFATSASNEAAMVVCSENNRGTADTGRFQKTDRCILQLVTNNATAVDAEAEFVSKTSTDFTINWVDAPATASIIQYMAIKGGNHHVNSFTQRSGTGTQEITDAGFQPEGYMLASFCRTSNASPVDHNILSFGGTDGTTEGVCAARDEDNVGTTAADTNESSADVFRSISPTADTVIDEANHDAMLSTGFRLNFTTSANLDQIFYWAFGTGAAPPARELFQRINPNASAMI